MLALDHRGSFRQLINPQHPDNVSDQQIVDLKSQIINSIQDQLSGLLIDEIYGLEACQEACSYKPFLLPLEKSGYKNMAGAKITELEYSVKQLIDYGASGAKLLVYFNPFLESAQTQLTTARQVLKDCQVHDFPFFLEIVTYTIQTPSVSDNSNLVLASLKKFISAGVIPDVWKLEYPGDVKLCQEITRLAGRTPWILLTGGDNFELFRHHLSYAIQAGAQGFLAGRALWQEVCQLQGQEKQQFLQKTLPDRFKIISRTARI